MKAISRHQMFKERMTLSPPSAFIEFPRIVTLSRQGERLGDWHFTGSFEVKYHRYDGRLSGEARATIYPVYSNEEKGESRVLEEISLSTKEFILWCEVYGKNPSDLIRTGDSWTRNVEQVSEAMKE